MKTVELALGGKDQLYVASGTVGTTDGTPVLCFGSPDEPIPRVVIKFLTKESADALLKSGISIYEQFEKAETAAKAKNKNADPNPPASPGV